jgi:thiosulfate dehydrogenase (quinone) large subunit
MTIFNDGERESQVLMDVRLSPGDISTLAEPRVHAGSPRVASHGLQTFLTATAALLRQHLSLTQIYLLPLRLFIGIGWMRASAEKLLNPEWRTGSELTSFLNAHVAQDTAAFPFYNALVTHAFLPQAALLSWVILIGQLLVGIAILTGTLTNLALLAGLFMNLNFVLIGEPNPSAFYIVIQAALLISHTGFVLGGDARLSRRWRNPLLVAQLSTRPTPWLGRRSSAAGALLALGLAGYCLLHVTDFSPGGSVADPAMILTIMALLTAMWFTISYLRQVLPAPAAGIANVGGGVLSTDPPVARPTFRRIA